MTTKIKMKVGHVEFEYEGNISYTAADVKDLFSYLESLTIVSPAASLSLGSNADDASSEFHRSASAKGSLESFAPNTVAARIEARSGSDLAIAAAAYIQLCKGKSTFSRKELLEAMQAATNYYQTNMRSNLTQTLKTLISNRRINSLSNNQMSLSANEQTSLRAKIDQ